MNERMRVWFRPLTGARGGLLSYALLRTIMDTARRRDLILANPCRVRGAGGGARPADPPGIAGRAGGVGEAMPARYRLMVLLAAWCALRFGELTELRRSDIDVKHGVSGSAAAWSAAATAAIVKDPEVRRRKRDVTSRRT